MNSNKPHKIAIVGAGITGLGAALRLSEWAQVTLFEQGSYIGGHSNAVDVTLDTINFPVDTGFLVFNDKTYPQLIALFKELDVPIAESNMSFAASVGPYDYEWCGSDDLWRALAQPSNLFKPRFWSMVRDMMRFNRQATELANSNASLENISLGQFLSDHHYGKAFQRDYLLPMAAAIWSCPVEQIMAFPLHTFLRFCDNHGLLQVNQRPKWKTVRGSSREYVKRMVSKIQLNGSQVLGNSGVTHVKREHGKAWISTDKGEQPTAFDAVLMACHTDQSLQILAAPTAAEKSVLSAITYQPNRAILHTDIKLMPKRRAAWAAWNYLSKHNPDLQADLSVTYWLNRLQPLPFKTDIFVSLNPIIEPAKDKVIQALSYAHPVFDLAAVQAQKQLINLQGHQSTWFAGAWTRYGFHEDGLMSGLAAAQLMHEQLVGAQPLAQAA
jgi:uncharacterized protein